MKLKRPLAVLFLSFPCTPVLELWAMTLLPSAVAAEESGFPCDDCNLLIISITNLRADHLGVYGYSRKTSPNLDAFAQKSLVFEQAFSHASWTLPAAISLFTSQYPFTHGLMNRKSYTPLSPQVSTLMDVLKANGYITAAFVGDRDYSRAFGHTSRFDYLYDCVSAGEQEDWHTYGVLARTVPRAITWLKQNAGHKFFAFVQGYDVHCPFALPKENNVFDPDYKGTIDFTKCYWTFGRTKPIKVTSKESKATEVYLLKTSPEDGEEYEAMLYPEDVRHMVALYDGEILSADELVGTLLRELEALDLVKKTIVVVLSEHGDMMGKHGRFMRGGPLRGTFYDDVLRIPLIIRHPQLKPARVRGFVQLIDLAPTFLDMVGLPPPDGFVGKSLRQLVTRGEEVNPYALAGSVYSPKKTNVFFRNDSIILSVRSQEWKLIHERLFLQPRPQDHYELFDLKRDADELENVAEKNPAKVEELKRVLNGWLKEIGARQITDGLAR